jgi:hypothetical protein
MYYYKANQGYRTGCKNLRTVKCGFLKKMSDLILIFILTMINRLLIFLSNWIQLHISNGNNT